MKMRLRHEHDHTALNSNPICIPSFQTNHAWRRLLLAEILSHDSRFMAISFVTCIHLLLLCSASLNTSSVRLAHHNKICLCDTSKHHRANKNADLVACASNSVSLHPIDQCKLTVRNRPSCICGQSQRPRRFDMVPRFLDLVCHAMPMSDRWTRETWPGTSFHTYHRFTKRSMHEIASDD